MSGSLHLLTSETTERDDKSENLECRMVSPRIEDQFVSFRENLTTPVNNTHTPYSLGIS